MRRCIEQIDDLTSREMSLVAKLASVQQEESGVSVASIGMLKTQLAKVKVEVTSEEKVKTNIEVCL